MAEAVFNVLFLCTGNSARSIIGEAVLNRSGRGRFQAFSAGSQPKGEVHPLALDLLGRLGFPLDGLRSKSWDEFAGPAAPAMDFIFTLCDSAQGESCPVWLGHPMTAHWGLPDPAAIMGSETERKAAFAEAYRNLDDRISRFVNLPLASLDRQVLERRLREIGQSIPRAS